MVTNTLFRENTAHPNYNKLGGSTLAQMVTEVKLATCAMYVNTTDVRRAGKTRKATQQIHTYQH